VRDRWTQWPASKRLDKKKDEQPKAGTAVRTKVCSRVDGSSLTWAEEVRESAVELRPGPHRIKQTRVCNSRLPSYTTLPHPRLQSILHPCCYSARPKKLPSMSGAVEASDAEVPGEFSKLASREEQYLQP
jgi:hypothetical protein